jgi:hypothetical protein
MQARPKLSGQVVSGPGGLASFLRRNLRGKPLGGPVASFGCGVGRPTRSRSTCAAWWPCATNAAAIPADTSSKHTLTARVRCRLVRRVRSGKRWSRAGWADSSSQ